MKPFNYSVKAIIGSYVFFNVCDCKNLRGQHRKVITNNCNAKLNF